MSERIANRVVLDTHAVLAFFYAEPGGERVAEILDRGEPWMTLVNLGEVVYAVERAEGKQEANDIFANMLSPTRPGSEVHWLPVETALVRRAASLKAIGGMSYADCFAAAAAALLGCPVVTGDPEFKAAERAGIPVEWL